MPNYQLHNTNVLLSGQQKWDIILESDGELYIKDFHISPINDNIPYTREFDETLLNYNHQENLYRFHSKVLSDFYNVKSDADMSDSMPLVDVESKYSDLYIAGPKKSQYHELYGKQFEVLCPLWLEDLTKPIHFEFEVTNHSGVIISSKILKFESLGRAFHDKFIKYFDDHIKFLGLDKTYNNDIYIDLDQKVASVTGYNISTKSINTVDCDSLTEDLLEIERPMMETDYMLCSLFKNNNMICRQLINMNFFLNIEDIMSHILEKSLFGVSGLSLNVNVYIGGKLIEKRMFFTNYESIYRYIIKTPLSKGKSKSNIFSYLNDYKCADIVAKNKLDPYICHWSIDGNPDYIFNLYSGFGAVYSDGRTRKYINNRYYNTPDLFVSKYDEAFNNINWCNHSMDFTFDNMVEFEVESKNWKELGSNFNSLWVNNIQYKTKTGVDMYVYLGVCNSMKDFNKIRMYGTLDFTKDISCKLIDDRFIIVSNNPDKLTFSSFRNELKNIDFSNTTGLDLSQIESLKALEVIKKRLVEEVIIPKNIVIKNTLRPVVTEGPTQEIKEIHYIKNDNYRTIQRYDGYITPTFIKLNDNKFYNFIYYKQEASDDIYNKITDYEGYDAVYPSIGYYFISKSAIDKYTPSNFEYRYFNNNKILILAKSIEKTIDSLEGVDKAVEKAIRVANNLEAKAALVKKNKYIYSLYKYTYEETEDKKYLIKIELK